MSRKQAWVASVLIVVLGSLSWLAIYAGWVQSQRDFQGMVGSIYENSPEQAEQLLQSAYAYRDADYRVALTEGEKAIKQFGYTDAGYRLLFRGRRAGMPQLVLIMLSCVVFGGLFCYVWRGQHERKKYIWSLCTRIYDAERREDAFSVLPQEQEWAVLEEEVHALLEQRLAQKRYMEDKEKQIQVYIENIAHQIKTPLAGILLNIERIERRLQRTKDKEGLEDCERLVEDSLLLGTTIRQHIMQLLNLARMEAGKIHFRKDVVELSELLGEVQRKYSEEGIEMETEEDVLIRGDREWLFEALCSIVENALSHGNTEQPIKIQMVNLAEEVKISVIDYGQGMNQEEMEKVFERYYTGGTSRQFTTGIGMNLARYVIRGHYGDMGIESSKSYGTRVHFFLPKIPLKEKVSIT